MNSAIQTLTDGLVYCENYLKENPNCSGQNKRIKGQQIIEHKKALKILTDIETSEANLTIPDVVCSLDSKSKTIGLTFNKKYKVLAEHKDDNKHIDEIAIINDFGDFGIYTREHFV